MPLEIRELVIKATLSGEEGNHGAPGKTSSGNQQDKDQALVRACVDAVLEILKQRKER